jgi:hypothetical protein
MKVNNFLLTMAVMAATLCAQAQLNVNSGGVVTIPNRLFITGNGNTFRFLPDNPGTEIGSSTDKIDFWYTGVGFNKLVAEKYDKISDQRLKTNIQPLEKALHTLIAIKTYTYNYTEKEEIAKRTHYGVIAQELQEILPDLVDTSHGYFTVDYDELIPLLINAVQELDNQVKDLQKQLSERDEILPYKMGNAETGEARELILHQNVPNPFSSATTIQGYIPQEISKVQLCIYNMQGAQVKCIPVTDRGDVSVTVAAGQLSAGVYTYILIGDSQTSDAKQMILTK